MLVLADATSATSKLFKYILQVRQKRIVVLVWVYAVREYKSGLEDSGISVGLCSKGVLDLMSGLENSGVVWVYAVREYWTSCLAWRIVVLYGFMQ